MDGLLFSIVYKVWITPFLIPLWFMKIRKHIKLTLTGKIQRQGLRFYTVKKAYEIGISGSVNWQSPEVLIIHVEGTQPQLDSFITWISNGPPGVKVDSLLTEELPLRDFQSFEMS
jgi:acylphosphatase